MLKALSRLIFGNDIPKEVEVVRTYAPKAQQWQPGALYSYSDNDDGPMYRITRIVRLDQDTALIGGGSAACWSVMGIPLNGDEQ